MRKLIFLFIFYPCTLFSQGAKRDFMVTPNITAAYEQLLSFQLKNGQESLAREIKDNPNNALIFLLQNYYDFVQLTFNENPTLYKKTLALKDKRLSIIQQSNASSPYFLLSKGIIHLQWSMMHVKNKEFLRATKDFKKANEYFKQNKKKFPSFQETNIFLGAQEAIIGSIPDNYKWISSILGLKGNLSQGMLTVRNAVPKKNELFKLEAQFYYVYLTEILLNDSKKALSLINAFNLDTKNIYLFTFMKANLQLNNFQATKALETIQTRNTSSQYFQPPVFYYQKGNALLNIGKYEEAIQQLKLFLPYTSDFYKKDACYKICISYYLLKNMKQANYYKQQIKSVGTADTDVDKQAQKFAAGPGFDHPELLKARLLFDGGQFVASISILENVEALKLTQASEELERVYRLARNYDESNNIKQAIIFYKKSLSLPNPNNAYFPARAALQLAYIYENQGNKTLALYYFKRVINHQDHSFKSSLDQKAKSGILRLQGK